MFLARMSSSSTLRSMLLTSLGLVSLLTWSIDLAAGQSVLKPLPVENALAMWSFGIRAPIDLSPDGQFVAYTLINQARRETPTNELHQVYRRTGASRDVEGSVLWLTNVKSGESRQLIEGPSRSWGGSWSPDGRYLAFYSDKDGEAGLWVWERNTGNARRVSSAIVRPFFQFELPQWSPDSKKLLVKVLPEGLSLVDAAALLINPATSSGNGGSKSSVIVFDSKPATKDTLSAQTSSGVWTKYLADLALIDMASGSIRRLVRQYKAGPYFLSPDGAAIAYTEYKGWESLSTQQTTVDISMVVLSDLSPRVLVRNVRMGYGLNISWSPDSKYLAYAESGPVAKGDCFIIPIKTGTPKNLTEDVHTNFSDDYRPPVWDAKAQTIYCIGDRNLWAIPIEGKPRQLTEKLDKDVVGIVAQSNKGRVISGETEQAIYVSTRDSKTMQVGFYSVGLDAGTYLKLIEESKAYGGPFTFSVDVSDDGQKVVYLAQDAKNNMDMWLADPSFRLPRRITRINPSLDNYEMGDSRLVQWKSDDGESLQGSLLLPAGYNEGQRYPMIVDVYGGSLRRSSALVNRFGFGQWGIANFQLLATRGYVVFLPDIPVKIGSPMRSIASSVLPGVNKIIEMGIADPDRIGVMGTSYGGYCVLALLVQTSRFKAAMSSAGSGNLIGKYGALQSTGEASGIGWAEEGQGSMGGSLWEFRQRYIENSPIFYLDKVSTPLLLVHGVTDTTVPAFLADEVFVGLRRLNKEVLYLKYQAGEHGTSSFNSMDSIDYFNRFISFFDERLKK